MAIKSLPEALTPDNATQRPASVLSESGKPAPLVRM